MEIVKFQLENSADWEALCQSSDDAWWWQTAAWLDYSLRYKPEYRPESKSFVVTDAGKLVAACPLILESIAGVNEFSSGDDYGLTPFFANALAPKNRERVMKLVFDHIDQLAGENNVVRARLRFPVLNKSFLLNPADRSNYLLQFGYLDASINSRIIDLRQPIADLRRDVRHGHDADIDRMAKILQSEIFTAETITPEIFDQYTQLHHKAAGRITRSQDTFDLMYQWITQSQAMLVGAKKAGRFIGFSYFFLYKDNVYYGSSCNDPEFSQLSISHFIQWTAVEWLQQHQYQFYEAGWQYYGPTLADIPSDKDLAISRFKRGFGGFSVPLFRGEKYYSKDFFQDTYNERIVALTNSLFSKPK